MLDIQIDTSPLLAFARKLERHAPFVLDEIREGVEQATDATRDAIREFTPKDKGLTAEGVKSATHKLGSTEVEGFIRYVSPPGRPADLFEWLNDGTRPHRIETKHKGKNGKRGMLKFAVGGATLFRGGVNHPGTKPYHQVERGIAAAADDRARAYRNTIRRIAYRLRR